MNPDTGEFHLIDDTKKKKNSVTSHEAKAKGWPIFEIGEEIIIKGYTFELLHLKHSSGRIVLRPKISRTIPVP